MAFLTARLYNGLAFLAMRNPFAARNFPDPVGGEQADAAFVAPGTLTHKDIDKRRRVV